MITQDNINEIRWAAAQQARELRGEVNDLQEASHRAQVEQLVAQLDTVVQTCLDITR